jgi:EmrB/QacA subfamily drug resistance transporter
VNKSHKLILLATILASGMAFLDGSVVNVALPTIQAKLGVDVSGIQWIVNAYILTLASFILVSGSLGDRYGRKKIFCLGIVLFTISSLLCSLSSNITQLIISRAIQGVGAAMMIPGSLSIINTSFDEKIRGKAIGLWSGLAGGVAAIGPFIGGSLVEVLGWQSIFFINLPIGLLALFITLKYVPESKNNEATKLDLIGTALITLGLFGVAFGLIYGPTYGFFDVKILTSLVLGIVFLIAFIYIEKKTKQPLVPLQIFKSPLVVGANLVTLFLYFALNGVIFFLVLNFQQIQNYSPIYAGMSLLPPILLISFLSGPAGALADKIGPRTPMIIGPLLVSIGLFSFTLTGAGSNYFTSFLPGLLLFGGGMALVIAPLTKSALAVDQKYSGAASGVNNCVARVAALLAIALLGAIIVILFKTNLSSSIQSSSLSFDKQQVITSQQEKLGGIEIPASFTSSESLEAKSIIQQSFIDGFRVIIGLAAMFALLSSGVSYLLIKNSAKS